MARILQVTKVAFAPDATCNKYNTIEQFKVLKVHLVYDLASA